MASLSTASPPRRFTARADGFVMNRLSLAGTMIASTSSSAISPCQTSISMGTGISLARCPLRRDWQLCPVMEPRKPAANGGRHFVVDGAALNGDLIGGDLRSHLFADQDEFVGVGYIIDLADIDGQPVHADRAHDRCKLAVDQHQAIVGMRPRPAIAVADAQGGDAGRLRGAVPEAVADG